MGVDRTFRRLRGSGHAGPHARGGGPFECAVLIEDELQVPTRVGVDRHNNICDLNRNTGPHARGGGPTATSRTTSPTTRSPRAWGWTANAGNESDNSKAGPHARGGGPQLEANWAATLARSPRAWGWTVTLDPNGPPRDQVPTRVGVDRGLPPGQRLPRAGPHARGGGPMPWGERTLAPPRSPRAWGWTARPERYRDPGRPGPHARGGGP